MRLFLCWMPLFAVVLLHPESAQAGCDSGGSGCLMPLDMTHTFAPAKTCLTVRQDANDCVCSVNVWIKNTCNESLGAEGFEFLSLVPYTAGGPYEEIPTDYEGSVDIRSELDDEGPVKRVFQLQLGSEKIDMTLDFRLEPYQSGVGCRLGEQMPPGSGRFLLLSLLALGFVRWRCRAGP